MRTTTMPVATIQFSSVPLNPAANLERMSDLVAEAHARGARLIVFPELACTGYVEHSDLHALAEDAGGSTVQTLTDLSRHYGVYLAAGFVEWHAGHVYNSLSFSTPDGEVYIYRKRHLIFWEHYYFRHAQHPLIVETEFGRIGFAICADMMYDGTWSQYRGKIDMAIISAAWPRVTPQTAFPVSWLLRPSWSLAGQLPSRIARDLEINVVFSNQCGPCQVRIPCLGPATPAAFAARSGIFDHQGHRTTAESDVEEILLGTVSIPEEHLPCVTLSA